ncbi:Protein FAR1-RELATED SEQUENCE 1 [Striga hermonthica]|uniref:Protein FAR1-RELATED SEQUENCE 1 n=1 Tax=Striga hermonthica TaxID=68872 RepID=A0A9N7R1M0_STRHE|nr:Protein FAR1-RELATED SEQUENCE 1 [Striga hermonthica]
MSYSENDGRMEFTIRDIDGKTFNVMHNANLNTSHCSCKHFEMYGWLCRHAFVVMKDMKVDVIPPAHIMSRWTKLAISTPMFRILYSISEECAQIDERKSMVNQLWSDLHICMGFAEKHVDHLVEFSKIIEAHKRKLVEYQESDSSGNDRGHIFESFVGMSAPSEVSIHSPTQSKNKGSGRRMKTNKEKSIETSNKKRRICKLCGGRAGHNARTCPKKP